MGKAATGGQVACEARTALVGSIQKFSVEDGPGIRTTVFLKGCPLDCAWCHNPELISPAQQVIASPASCIGCGCCLQACANGALSPREGGGMAIDAARCTACLACTRVCTARALRPVARAMTAAEVLAVVEQDADFYRNTGGGMTLSGGEVLAHAAFAAELVDGAAARGICTCLDTSGQGPAEVLRALACRESVTDVLYDVKAVDPVLHERLTGVGNELILGNLRMLAADALTARKVTVRMPLVAGENDGDAAIDAALALFAELGLTRVDLLPYHDLGQAKARNIGGSQRAFQPPSDARVAELRSRFEAAGLRTSVFGVG